MADSSPWTSMQAPVQPEPSTSGTSRTYGNMLNERPLGKKMKKPRKMGTHWELPQKLKLSF